MVWDGVISKTDLLAGNYCAPVMRCKKLRWLMDWAIMCESMNVSSLQVFSVFITFTHCLRV